MGLEPAIVEEIIHELRMPDDLWAANFNCPGQVVISGTLGGIEAGSKRAKERGAKRVIPLQVHGAFHSGLMRSSEEKLAPEIANTPLHETKVGLVMNFSGAYVDALQEIRYQLIKQVTHPVRWEQGIRAMHERGVDLFIEIGCGKTLGGMNKRIGVEAPTISIEKVTDLETLALEIL